MKEVPAKSPKAHAGGAEPGSGTPSGTSSPGTHLEERELIERIKAGDKELFYELIRPHERRVYLTAFAISGNRQDAEEIAQEAILKAFSHLGQFRFESQFSTWLTRVTINEARMRRRKDHREMMKPLSDGPGAEEGEYVPQEFPDWREIPSEVLERRQLVELLNRAVESLAPKYREVFVLRDMENLSIQETAEALEISAGAVKTRLLRARLMLRDQLARVAGNYLSGPQAIPKGTNPWL